MSVRLGLHLWSCGACTVREAANIARALDLDYLDLGNGRDLDMHYIAAHPEEEVARFARIKAETGITFVDAFPQLPPTFSLNHPDVAVRNEQRRVYERFIDFAAQIGLTGVTFTPGRYWNGESMADDFARGAEELRGYVGAGEQRGLQIRIESHIESVTWTPELTLHMLDAVPGLSLTLDYSHFVFHGIPNEHIAVLDPHATHWHARQAKPGAAQCRHDEGTIDFARIASGMVTRGYNGVWALEYVHGAWMNQDRVDCLSETVRLRDTLQGVLANT